MCHKASIAICLTIISTCWFQVTRARRIQAKIEIQNDGLETTDDTQHPSQKSYILLHDAAKKSINRPLHSNKEATTSEESHKLKATAMLLAAQMKDRLPFNTSNFTNLNTSSSLVELSLSHRKRAAAETAASLQSEDKEEPSEAANSTSLLSKLPTLVQAVFAGHLPVHPVGEYVWYCSIAILAMLICSCSCCFVDWAKTVRRHYMAHKSAQKLPVRNDALARTEAPAKRKSSSEVQGRHQYKHKGRLIYEWQQTNSSLMVFTKLPEGIKKNTIEVKIWPRHMKIGRVGKIPFLKEELFSLVDVSESAWDILGNGELAVSLRKSQPMEWPCVFRAHHPDKVEVQ